MKKYICIFLSLLLLTGCASTVNLLENADPDSSGLFLYYYDGETGVHQSMFENAAEKEILAVFQNAKAEPLPDFDPGTMKAPFYAIEMGAGDYGMSCGLWSDGVFLTKSGEAYAFDYDFEALRNHPDFRQESTYELPGFLYLPLAAKVVKDKNGWDATYLQPSELGTPAEGIGMTLISADKQEIVVEFSNQSGEEWTYGEYYHLEALVDGTWYRIPTDSEQEWGFHDIAYILMDGNTRRQTYHLGMYGTLPSGTYRVVAENMTAEFEIS